MNLRCYAYFRDILGTGELEYTDPADTLGDLLADLTRRYGRPFARWVYTEEGRSREFSPLSIILINGKDARDLQGLATPLDPTDTIVLFPPLAGG
jgi:sulfur-carrier protein